MIDNNLPTMQLDIYHQNAYNNHTTTPVEEEEEEQQHQQNVVSPDVVRQNLYDLTMMLAQASRRTTNNNYDQPCYDHPGQQCAKNAPTNVPPASSQWQTAGPPDCSSSSSSSQSRQPRMMRKPLLPSVSQHLPERHFSCSSTASWDMIPADVPQSSSGNNLSVYMQPLPVSFSTTTNNTAQADHLEPSAPLSSGERNELPPTTVSSYYTVPDMTKPTELVSSSFTPSYYNNNNNMMESDPFDDDDLDEAMEDALFYLVRVREEALEDYYHQSPSTDVEDEDDDSNSWTEKENQKDPSIDDDLDEAMGDALFCLY